METLTGFLGAFMGQAVYSFVEAKEAEILEFDLGDYEIMEGLLGLPFIGYHLGNVQIVFV